MRKLGGMCKSRRLLLQRIRYTRKGTFFILWIREKEGEKVAGRVGLAVAWRGRYSDKAEVIRESCQTYTEEKNEETHQQSCPWKLGCDGNGG